MFPRSFLAVLVVQAPLARRERQFLERVAWARRWALLEDWVKDKVARA